jgi:hypothetical protein
LEALLCGGQVQFGADLSLAGRRPGGPLFEVITFHFIDELVLARRDVAELYVQPLVVVEADLGEVSCSIRSKLVSPSVWISSLGLQV